MIIEYTPELEKRISDIVPDGRYKAQLANVETMYVDDDKQLLMLWFRIVDSEFYDYSLIKLLYINPVAAGLIRSALVGMGVSRDAIKGKVDVFYTAQQCIGNEFYIDVYNINIGSVEQVALVNNIIPMMD